MACPGGCTNGGGQIKLDDLGPGQAQTQKEFLAKVDEAYYSMSSEDDEASAQDEAGAEDTAMPDAREQGYDGGKEAVREVLKHWEQMTGVEMRKLAYTSFRKVESDVGKEKGGASERAVELAGKIGGGW